MVRMRLFGDPIGCAPALATKLKEQHITNRRVLGNELFGNVVKKIGVDRCRGGD
jgi:hypothetical protein